jgi:hypothetical protein
VAEVVARPADRRRAGAADLAVEDQRGPAARAAAVELVGAQQAQVPAVRARHADRDLVVGELHPHVLQLAELVAHGAHGLPEPLGLDRGHGPEDAQITAEVLPALEAVQPPVGEGLPGQRVQQDVWFVGR